MRHKGGMLGLYKVGAEIATGVLAPEDRRQSRLTTLDVTNEAEKEEPRLQNK